MLKATKTCLDEYLCRYFPKEDLRHNNYGTSRLYLLECNKLENLQKPNKQIRQINVIWAAAFYGLTARTWKEFSFLATCTLACEHDMHSEC